MIKIMKTTSIIVMLLICTSLVYAGALYTKNGIITATGTGVSSILGKLGIGTSTTSADLMLDVEGKVGATEYCDQDGNNCKTIDDMGGSSGNFWQSVSYEDFESGAGDWSPASTYTCLTGILGRWGNEASCVTKTFDLSAYPHTVVRVSADYWYGDSWDNEKAYARLDGVEVWAVNHGQHAGSVCGSSPPDLVHHIELEKEHTGNTLNVEFCSSLDQGATDEWFGVDNVELSVLINGGSGGGSASLRTDCSINEILKWDGSSWVCSADGGSGESYDSGWFPISSGHTEVLTHNLGTKYLMTTILWTADDAVESPIYDLTYDTEGSYGYGAQVTDITDTQLTVQAGNRWIRRLASDGSYAGDQPVTGYLRLIASAGGGGSSGFTPSNYNGQESITYPNGMIMKTGYHAGGDGIQTVTFQTGADIDDFTAPPVSISLTPYGPDYHFGTPTVVSSPAPSNSGFTVDINGGPYTGFYWTAIGR